jgi:hypothetical protein
MTSRMGWLLGWMSTRRIMSIINAVGERCKIERLNGVNSRPLDLGRTAMIVTTVTF